jgi:hypothetical protein
VRLDRVDAQVEQIGNLLIVVPRFQTRQ